MRCKKNGRGRSLRGGDEHAKGKAKHRAVGAPDDARCRLAVSSGLSSRRPLAPRRIAAAVPRQDIQIGQISCIAPRPLLYFLLSVADAVARTKSARGKPQGGMIHETCSHHVASRLGRARRRRRRAGADSASASPRTTSASTAIRRPTRRAFIEAAEARSDGRGRRARRRRRRGAPDRADAGPDPAGRRRHHHLADQRQAVVPWCARRTRPASRSSSPTARSARPASDFIASFSGPDNITQGQYAADDDVRRARECGPGGADRRPAGLHHRHRAPEGLRGRASPSRCPDVEIVETQPGD